MSTGSDDIIKVGYTVLVVRKAAAPTVSRRREPVPAERVIVTQSIQ